MSNFEKNYEKTTIAICAFVALAFIALAVFGFLGLNKFFQRDEVEKNDLAVSENIQLIEESSSKLTSPIQWSEFSQDGRNLNLLTPLSLFVKEGETELIDLYKGDPVHPPVDNSWWLEYGLDPGIADSLQLDPDKDGFSNLEEFEAKTSPIDDSNYPTLINKLMAKEVTKLKTRLTFSSDGGEQYRFKYQDSKRIEVRSPFIEVGSRFFDEEPVKSRYILQEVEDKEIEKNGFTSNRKQAKIQDTVLDKTFEVFYGSNYSVDNTEYTVSFVLDAVGKSETPFPVTENTRFDLPSCKVSEDGQYLFEGVEDNQAVISWTENGKENSIKLALSE